MSYRRVIVDEFGGPEVMKVVQENTPPEPQAGEACLKVLAAGVSFSDTLVRGGKYFGLKEKPPLTPGYEVMGIVDSLGPGTDTLQAGQTVADLTVLGAYSEYMLRPVESLIPVPPSMDPAEVVSLVLSYVSAYQMLHRLAKVEPGSSILVHGAGGAVGSALLQLGTLLDLEMYGTASKPKHDLVASLGAKPIDYKIEDFASVVTAAGGVDAAFDAIGGDNFRRSFDTLKKDGTLIAYGYYNNAAGKGGSVPVDYLKLLFWNIMPNRRKTIFYSIVPERDKHPEWFKEDLTALVNLLAEGKIKPVIERRMELEQAAQAHELVEQAAVKGRLVLAVNDG